MVSFFSFRTNPRDRVFMPRLTKKIKNDPQMGLYLALFAICSVEIAFT